MLINETMTEKNVSNTFILPEQWKMRQLSETAGKDLSLTKAQRNWLDNHELTEAGNSWR